MDNDCFAHRRLGPQPPSQEEIDATTDRLVEAAKSALAKAPEPGAKNTFNILTDLVGRVACKPNWSFELVDEDGALRLVITVPGRDSYNPDRHLTVRHFFPVPTTTYNEKSWQRWMFERCRRLENHELGEWFRIDGRRPFAPTHGPGEDPYTVHEFRSEVDARTLQDGSISTLKV